MGKARSRHVNLPLPFVATALMMLVGSSAMGVASAAAWTDERGSDSKTADLANGELGNLVIDQIDHVPVDADTGRSPEDVPDARSTPFLYLSPRVATVMRDIFGDDRLQADDDPENLPAADIEADDVTDMAEVDEEVVSGPVTNESDVVPLIQRQMYRIDI